MFDANAARTPGSDSTRWTMSCTRSVFACAVDTLRRAADLAGPARVSLLIENISPATAPGYLAATVEQSAELIEAAGHPAVGMQLDQYHVSMVGADPLAAAERYGPLVRHIQIADAPGRHQPGTGQAPIGPFLDELDEIGYRGHVGLEYVPQGSMQQALAWLPRDLRGR